MPQDWGVSEALVSLFCSKPGRHSSFMESASSGTCSDRSGRTRRAAAAESAARLGRFAALFNLCICQESIGSPRSEPLLLGEPCAGKGGSAEFWSHARRAIRGQSPPPSVAWGPYTGVSANQAWPVQLACPHVHIISVLFAMPSQWALQYFDFSSGTQLHAAFAHFLELAMVLLCRSTSGGSTADRFDAGFEWKGSTRVSILGRYAVEESGSQEPHFVECLRDQEDGSRFGAEVTGTPRAQTETRVPGARCSRRE